MSRDYVQCCTFPCVFASRKPFCTVVWPPFVERNTRKVRKTERLQVAQVDHVESATYKQLSRV